VEHSTNSAQQRMASESLYETSTYAALAPVGFVKRKNRVLEGRRVSDHPRTCNLNQCSATEHNQSRGTQER